MNDTAKPIKCPNCIGTMLPVHNAERGILKGWWCPICGATTKAIGRERQLKIDLGDRQYV